MRNSSTFHTDINCITVFAEVSVFLSLGIWVPKPRVPNFWTAQATPALSALTSSRSSPAALLFDRAIRGEKRASLAHSKGVRSKMTLCHPSPFSPHWS